MWRKEISRHEIPNNSTTEQFASSTPMLTRSLLLTAAAAALVSSQTEPAVERSNELFAEFGRDPTSTGLVGQYLLDNGYLAAFENSDAVAIGPESEVDCSLYPDGSFEYCEWVAES